MRPFSEWYLDYNVSTFHLPERNRMMRSRVSARPSLCLLGVNADARLDGAYHSVMWVLQIGLFGIGVLGLPFL